MRAAAGSALASGLAAGTLSCSTERAAGVRPDASKIPTQCQGCGANRCGIYVYVKNGRVWKADGNPKTYNNAGTVCPRGHAYIQDIYNPDRIKQPLKRTDKGTYEPITWEQAFEEISTKLNLLIMDDGPQSVFWIQYPMANMPLAFRFMHALGSPNTITHGATCFTARNAAFNATCGGLPDNDLKNSRYIIMVGRNPAGGVKLQQIRDIAEAKRKGARLVVLDPRHSETAVMADDWLAVRPASDLAFLLAMINVIIEEGLYDHKFVEEHTIGFDSLRDEIVTYPPEWAEKICDIPKETIYRIAREFAFNKPRALIHRGYHGGYGAGYLNSFQTARAVAIANFLIGNYERVGGLFMPLKPTLGELEKGGHPAPAIPDVEKADGAGVPGRYPTASYSDGIAHAVPELALAGKLKAGFVYHMNPVRTNPNPARVIAGYKKLELLVTIDCVMSETAALSHYVLPESFFLERDDHVDTVHSGPVAQLTMVQQVVKPMYDTKPLLEIITGLSRGLGIGKYFNFTMDELNDLRLRPFGVTLDELKKGGVIEVGPRWEEGFKPCKTPSGKIEFYSSQLEAWGLDPMPRWQEPLVAPDSSDKNSFRLLHGKQAIHTHSMTANVPYLMELSSRYDMIRLWINRKRAEAIGLKDGDTAVVESDIGKGTVRVRLTDGLHPSAVWMPSGYGIFSKYLTTAYGKGINYNDFLDTYFDPAVGHIMSNEIIVRVAKA
ncbi:molybdopterin oxidoreductase [Candidatus Magnetominusculus xianensis]|uniref:Molybdopterin oxidoreductase n=2 Tax=Candidatus Magnetominusculus xianensis TaxID=1748249 RepID=A0ABR5SKG9_9BACT|nr:molybdopterin oxidoreductase [Candidatus Magnetominusculus xianensis]